MMALLIIQCLSHTHTLHICVDILFFVVAFVINHSFHYTLAFLASLVEFWVETALFGASKRYSFAIVLGLVCMLGGQVSVCLLQ